MVAMAVPRVASAVVVPVAVVTVATALGVGVLVVLTEGGRVGLIARV